MDLTLALKNTKDSGLLWSGASNKPIGKLAPNTSTLIQLSLLAIKTGLQVCHEICQTGKRTTQYHSRITALLRSGSMSFCPGPTESPKCPVGPALQLQYDIIHSCHYDISFL